MLRSVTLLESFGSVISPYMALLHDVPREEELTRLVHDLLTPAVQNSIMITLSGYCYKPGLPESLSIPGGKADSLEVVTEVWQHSCHLDSGSRCV